MPISSNRRQRVIEFATPKVADLVIVERVDCSKNVSSAAVADDTAYGTAHPEGEKFKDFKLALIKNGDDEQGQFQDWYYVKDRDKQDDYNWEYQAAGASSPHYDTVVRTYVTLRTAFDPEEPQITDSMPIGSLDEDANDPFDEDKTNQNKADTGYILFEKKQTRSGDEFLDTLYVVEQHIYVRRVPMTRVDVDPEFPEHDALISKETLWYIGENPTATRIFGDAESTFGEGVVVKINGNPLTDALFEDENAEIDVHEDFEYLDEEGNPDPSVPPAQTTNFWGVDQHGVLREGKQLTDNWYAIIEKHVVGATGKLSTIETYQSYSWPAVLASVEVYSWARRAGGSDTVAVPLYKYQAWSGSTHMKIERFWQKKVWPMGESLVGTDIKLAKIMPMLPKPMNIVTPLFSVKVSSCLHENFIFTATTGTEHPIYKYIGSVTHYPPTNYTTWPEELVTSDTQAPFRGGYLRERTTAYKPRVAE